MRNIENIIWGSVAVREFMYRDSVDFKDSFYDRSTEVFDRRR